MDRIYRFAHRSKIKKGMYQQDHVKTYCQDTDRRHPQPYDDIKLYDFYEDIFTDKMTFGFVSREQAAFWLHRDDVREGLGDDGYVVYVMENATGKRGVDYELGDTQAIFDPIHFNLVEKVGVLDFFNS